MTIELEKIDLVRERTKATYREAHQALIDCDGIVIDAIIKIEEEKGVFQREEAKEREEDFSQENQYYVKGSQLVDKIKAIIRKGNVTRIKIRNQDEVLLDFPVTIGVVGAVIAPYLALLGAIAALVSHATIEVERPGNGEENGA